METIIIQAQSKSTTNLLVGLAKKLGEKVQILDKEIAEDLALGEMMNHQKTGRSITKDAILAELRK